MQWTTPPANIIPRSVQTGVCWWCGNTASSREHRIKRSDIIREFGSKIDPDILGINMGILSETLVGPNAKQYKFKPSLCASCNNARSQPFDKAQEQFANYFRDHEFEIAQDLTIPTTTIFNENLVVTLDDLQRYFVKHVGCRLVALGISPSQNLRDYLDSKDALRDLSFSGSICRSTFEILSHLPPEKSGMAGDDDVTALEDGQGNVFQMDSVWIYRSFHLHWSYRWQSHQPLVNPFATDMKLSMDPRPAIPFIIASKLEKQ